MVSTFTGTEQEMIILFTKNAYPSYKDICNHTKLENTIILNIIELTQEQYDAFNPKGEQ